MEQSEYDLSYADRQLNRAKNPLRRLVKRLYLNNIIRDIKGAAIDFGCGAGQLLERLPAGSIGMEVNPALVEALTKKKLPVQYYDPQDHFAFSDLPVGRFGTLILSHVLEHFENVASTFKNILKSCERLGIIRVVLVLPGERGYRHDITHKTFVDRDFLVAHNLWQTESYSVFSGSYFPFNSRSAGKIFTFNELKLVYEHRCPNIFTAGCR